MQICVERAVAQISAEDKVCTQGRNLSDNWGKGERLFIYSCYARRISFEIHSNSNELRLAEHEYMNKHPPPPISVLVTSLFALLRFVIFRTYTNCAVILPLLTYFQFALFTMLIYTTFH